MYIYIYLFITIGLVGIFVDYPTGPTQIDGWMDGWIDRQTDRQIDACGDTEWLQMDVK